MILVMIAIGAGLGAGAFALGWALVPRRTSVLVQLGRYDARDNATGGTGRGSGGTGQAQARLGSLLADWLAVRGIAYTSLRQDLALTGRTFEAALGRKALAFAAGFTLVIAVASVVQAAIGLRLPPGTALLLAVAVAAAAFFVPDLEARREAAARRRDFRRALSSYLDLVALEMYGSAAPAEALPAAARIGSGWPLALLRDELYRATVSGQEHWAALSDLGERIGVPELRDLGTLVRGVAHDGARVRDTLTARAASMRRAELADAEGQAGRREQSMRVAQILIGLGFVLFLLWPALVNVMAL